MACGCLSVPSVGQTDYKLGVLPGINLNKKISDGWRLNLKVESRQSIWESISEDDGFSHLRYELTDVSMMISRKTGLNNSIAAGYLIRFAGDRIHHRFIQQYTLVNRYHTIRLAHRISTDQTWFENQPPAFRLRYRISTDVPLNGQSVDKNEFYFKAGNEYIGLFFRKEFYPEIRIIPLLGFAFNDNNKLEWGLDYRVSKPAADFWRHTFWLSLNWYLSF